MEKTVSQSRSIIADIIMPAQANSAGNAHGGEIMKMMDTCGGAVAFKHARSNVVTLRVDELLFLKPVYVGQLVTVEAELTFVGSTSMEIKVCVYSEDMKVEGESQLCLTAFFTFVALDEQGKPKRVPALKIESNAEKVAYAQAKQRYESYKKNKG